MKNTAIVCFVVVGILSGCMQDDQLDEMSIQNEIALIGMNEAILAAIHYSDSLVSHTLETNHFNDSLCHYYDAHYHYQDSLYNFHHNDFQDSSRSFNQGCGASAGFGMRGNGMGNGGNRGQTYYLQHMNTDHRQMGHHAEDDYLMDSLRTAHQHYHPYN